MSQYERIQNSYIHIPADPKKADEFIGRWRACQELALKDVQDNNLTMEKNIDDIIDMLTIKHFKAIRRSLCL